MISLQENLSQLIVWGLSNQVTDILIEDGVKQRIEGLTHLQRIAYAYPSSLKHLVDFIVHSAKLSLASSIAQSEWMEVWTVQGFISVRVSYLKTPLCRFLTLRLVQFTTLDIKSLIIQPYEDALLKVHAIHDGLICFIGKAGSGKSTTLRSFLQSISHKRIISIEHPIESHLVFMMQIEQQHYDIEEMVYHALRHHPHVLVIEEVRNAHELKVAYEAALSGHLVCITFHAKDEQAARQRMVAMVPHIDCSLIKAWFCQKGKGVNADDFTVEIKVET